MADECICICICICDSMVFGIALDLVVFQKTDKRVVLLVVIAYGWLVVLVAVGFVANRRL